MNMTVKEVIEKIEELKKIRERLNKNLKISTEQNLYEETDKFNQKLIAIKHEIERLEESRVLLYGQPYI